MRKIIYTLICTNIFLSIGNATVITEPDLITPIQQSSNVPPITPTVTQPVAPITTQPTVISPVPQKPNPDPIVTLQPATQQQTSIVPTVSPTMTTITPSTVQPIINYNVANNPKGKRSCAEASTTCKSFGTAAILDFSNTTDFQLNGDTMMSQLYENLKQKGVKVITIDLSNSEVTSAFLQKWIIQLRQDNISVLWNISNNKSVTDQTIGVFENFNNIIGLNISNTSISDTGLQKILSMLNSESNIEFINVYNTLITKSGLSQFINGFNTHVNNWKQTHQGKEYHPFKGGVIYTMELDSDKQNVNFSSTQLLDTMKHNVNSPNLPLPNLNLLNEPKQKIEQPLSPPVNIKPLTISYTPIVNQSAELSAPQPTQQVTQPSDMVYY